MMLSRNTHNMTLKKPAHCIHLSHKEISQSFLSLPSSLIEVLMNFNLHPRQNSLSQRLQTNFLSELLLNSHSFLFFQFNSQLIVKYQLGSYL